MKKTYDPLKALEIPLTDYEQEIENAIEDGSMVAETKMNETVHQAARDSLRTLRGGASPGAGRKPRPDVRTTVLLAPSIRRKLERMAKEHGSLSAAVEKLVRSA